MQAQLLKEVEAKLTEGTASRNLDEDMQER